MFDVRSSADQCIDQQVVSGVSARATRIRSLHEVGEQLPGGILLFLFWLADDSRLQGRRERVKETIERAVSHSDASVDRKSTSTAERKLASLQAFRHLLC